MSLQVPPTVRKRKSEEMMDKESMEVDTMKRAAEVSATTHRHLDVKEIILQHRTQPEEHWIQRESTMRKRYWCCNCSKEARFDIDDKRARICKLCSHLRCGECAHGDDQYLRKHYWCCNCCKKTPVKKAEPGGGICRMCTHHRCAECLMGDNEKSVE
jgi:hypothetical protein